MSEWLDEDEGNLSDEAYNALLHQVYVAVSSHQHELDAVALITAAGMQGDTDRSAVGMMLDVMGGADGVVENPGRLLSVTVLLGRFCNFLMEVISHDDGKRDADIYSQLIAMLLDDAPRRNAEWLAKNGEYCE